MNKKSMLTQSQVSKLFDRCHDEIWNGGKNDPAFAFDEFSKLLTIKILDEKINGEKKSIFATPKKILNSYSKLIKKTNCDMFDTKIRLSEKILGNIIKLLEPVNISNIDLDIKGQALEDFLGKTFRDEYGQFFTPRTIVDFCVSVLDPSKKETIFDPCCGSGGFLIYALTHMARKGKIIPSKQLFGMEINNRIATTAMMEMLVHGDKSSNIKIADSLSYESTSKYSMILTNPPFGVKITDDEILKKYELKKYGKSEVLFIEKCHKLLNENGNMCIVLPDSILSNSSLGFVRDFIKNNFRILGIISLPQHAFAHSGAGVKSSLLFLNKKKSKQNYKIFMGIANHIGYDDRQCKDSNELDEILKNWKTKQTGKNSFFVNISDFKDSFSPSSFQTVKGTRLSELCLDIFTGITPSKIDYLDNGIKILKVRDMTGSGIRWNIRERGFVKHSYQNKKPLQKDDILIISSAHQPKYIGLKVDIINHIPKDHPLLYCVTEIMVIRPNPEKINPYKLMYLLKSKSGYDAIQSCIRGQTSHIYPKDVSNMILPKIELNEKTILDLKRMLHAKTEIDCKIHEEEQNLIGEL